MNWFLEELVNGFCGGFGFMMSSMCWWFALGGSAELCNPSEFAVALLASRGRIIFRFEFVCST